MSAQRRSPSVSALRYHPFAMVEQVIDRSSSSGSEDDLLLSYVSAEQSNPVNTPVDYDVYSETDEAMGGREGSTESEEAKEDGGGVGYGINGRDREEQDLELEVEGSKGRHQDERLMVEVEEVENEDLRQYEHPVVVIKDDSDVKLSVKVDCRSEGDESKESKESKESEQGEETSDEYTTAERLADTSASSRSHGLSSVATHTERLPIEHVVPLAPFELLSALDYAEYNPHTVGLDKCDHWIAHSLPRIEELEDGGWSVK
ncbi:hypothetical protein RSAG8_13142, partial [Rhizoctonia solani AG-8 WAC10335]